MLDGGEQQVSIDIADAGGAAQAHDAVDLAPVDIEHMHDACLSGYGETP